MLLESMVCDAQPLIVVICRVPVAQHKPCVADCEPNTANTLKPIATFTMPMGLI